MQFQDRLKRACQDADSALCIGLDPDPQRLPEDCLAQPEPLFAFCRAVVDATADRACAFKPQFACFAALGAEQQLRRLCGHIRARYPRIPVILDAKRGDIGSTARFYAQEAFEVYRADAVTVNPYLGWDAIAPFAEWPQRGVVVICHTSNADAGWLQEHPAEDPTYLRVAELISAKDVGNMALVVGATYPEQMAKVRERAPAVPFLVPGVGAQGGDVAAVFAHGLDAEGGGLVVNASRSILYASGGEDWTDAARRAATALRDEMRRSRDAALAGR